MKRLYLTIGMALLVAFLPAMAAVQTEGTGGRRDMTGRGRTDGRGDAGAGMILRLKEKLELNAEQVKQLEAIRDEVQGKFKAAAEAVKARREAMQKLAESGASEAEIRAAAAEVGNAIGDGAVLRAGTKTKVDAVLTDAQRSKLMELKEQRMEMRKERPGRGKQMGAGPKGGKGPLMGADAESVFAEIDTNKDGSIGLEEFKAHREQMRERRSGKGMAGRHRSMHEEHPSGN